MDIRHYFVENGKGEPFILLHGNGEDSSYYSQAIFETRIETIHHEAEGHFEDRVVQEAYDEPVLVSEAWDEEVIAGYVCEECGEVQ